MIQHGDADLHLVLCVHCQPARWPPLGQTWPQRVQSYWQRPMCGTTMGGPKPFQTGLAQRGVAGSPWDRFSCTGRRWCTAWRKSRSARPPGGRMRFWLPVEPRGRLGRGAEQEHAGQSCRRPAPGGPAAQFAEKACAVKGRRISPPGPLTASPARGTRREGRGCRAGSASCNSKQPRHSAAQQAACRVYSAARHWVCQSVVPWLRRWQPRLVGLRGRAGATRPGGPVRQTGPYLSPPPGSPSRTSRLVARRRAPTCRRKNGRRANTPSRAPSGQR